MPHVMTDADHTSLKKLERVIERGKKTFIEVGLALREIRDRKLYRATHKTFAGYVEEKHSFKRHNAYHLIDAAEVAGNVENFQQIGNAGQASEIAKAPPELQQEVVDRTLESNDKPTAKDFAETRKVVMAETVEDEPEVYEDWDEGELEAPDDGAISFQSICGDEFRRCSNRMQFVRDLIAELEPHELAIARDFIDEATS